MIKPLTGSEVAAKIKEQLPDAVAGYDGDTVNINSESVLDVCRFLNQTPEFEFDYLLNLTGVDYLDFFEIVYHLVSIKHDHRLTVKTRCYERDNAVVPSIVPVWKGADLQEREVYDLFGIRFEGHPNMKRILLWDGFQGHPLRRDFL